VIAACTCVTACDDVCPRCSAAHFADKPPVLATKAADDATRIEALVAENEAMAKRLGDTRADLLSLRQRLRETLGMAERATDDDLLAEAIKLMEHANQDGYDDRLLDHAFALLDLAAERNPTLQHIAAILRVGAGYS